MQIDSISAYDYLNSNSKINSKKEFFKQNFGASCPIEDTFLKSQSNNTQQENQLVDFIKKAKEFLFSTFCSIHSTKQGKSFDDFNVKNKKLSDEEKLAVDIYNNVAKELKMPKELQPQFYIMPFKTSPYGALYEKNCHSILLNSNILGCNNLEEVIMHEMTHCNERLKRAGIPQNIVNKIVQDELLSRVFKGESKYILVCGYNGKPVFMEPPVLSDEMKKDFINFAKDNLYNTSEYEPSQELKKYLTENMDFSDLISMKKTGQLNSYEERLLDGVVKLNEKYPEFKMQYKNEKQALKELFNYAFSHKVRYLTYTNRDIVNSEGKTLEVKELQGEELKDAEKSLVNFIETTEANLIYPNFDKSKENELMYTFAPEEILARINGKSYLIKCLEEKLIKLENTNTDEVQKIKQQISDVKEELELDKKAKELKCSNIKLTSKYVEMNEDEAPEYIIKRLREIEALKAKKLKSEIPEDIIKSMKEAMKSGIQMDITPAVE